MTLSTSFFSDTFFKTCRICAVFGVLGLPVTANAADSPAPQVAPASAASGPVASPAPAVATMVPVDQAAAPAPSNNELNAPVAAKIPSLSDALGQVPGGVAPAADASVPTPTGEPALADKVPGLDLPIQDVETPEQAEAKMRGEAYENMMNGVLPMNPDELRDAFGRMDINQKAIEEPLKFPKPEVSFTTISLDPAAVPLTFKLATGHVTTVNFLDITGQPWPIKDVTWAGNFEVKSSSQGVDEKFPMYPNLMRIIPLSEYAYGNMSIRLLGLSTPLTFTLRTNKDEVQYRLDLRVPEQGPFAMPSIINEGNKNTLKAGNGTLTRIMEGVPPETAERLTVNGVDGRTSAYMVSDTLYVRTPLTLLSPAWNESVRSADGMNVYALSTAPVLLLSDGGQMVRASLVTSQGKDHDESQ